MGQLSQLDFPVPRDCESISPQKFPFHSNHHIEYRMTRKTHLCRNCGMRMKGHSRLGCLIPNSTEQNDDRASMILSTPSFVIPETGTFRRQNPNYVPPSPPPSQMAHVLPSAPLTPTESVCSFPPVRQFTPNWSQPSSLQPHLQAPKQQSPFVLKSTSPIAALSQASIFGVQPGDSVRLVAGIYQIPSTTIESFRTRALSNGSYCVPIKLPKEERLQHVDLARSSWIITGPNPSDVDALIAILQPRGLVSQIMDALHYRTLALLLCIFNAILGWQFVWQGR